MDSDHRLVVYDLAARHNQKAAKPVHPTDKVTSGTSTDKGEDGLGRRGRRGEVTSTDKATAAAKGGGPDKISMSGLELEAVPVAPVATGLTFVNGARVVFAEAHCTHAVFNDEVEGATNPNPNPNPTTRSKRPRATDRCAMASSPFLHSRSANLSILVLSLPRFLSHEWRGHQVEDMICYSGNGVVSMKSGDFPSHQQRSPGNVFAFSGSKVQQLKRSKLACLQRFTHRLR